MPIEWDLYAGKIIRGSLDRRQGEVRLCLKRSVMVQTTAKSDYNRCFHMGQRAGSLESARQIVPIVLHLIRPKEVVDVGCGLGIWLSMFAEGGNYRLSGRGRFICPGGYAPDSQGLFSRPRFDAAPSIAGPVSLAVYAADSDVRCTIGFGGTKVHEETGVAELIVPEGGACGRPARRRRSDN